MDGLGGIGDLVGDRYVLRRLLGEGTYGRVWRAYDQIDQIEVALKLLRPQYVTKLRQRTRFEREADILSELKHPRITRALDYGTDPAHPYIAMALVEGETLLARLEATEMRGEMVWPTQVVEWANQVASALDYAHAIGVVHRDLKPNNIMLTNHGVEILDFGVARLMFESEVDRQTTVGRILGTLFYLSPEQASGEAAEPAADVFALGSVVFEMLTLRIAWAVGRNGEPLTLNQEPPKLDNSIVEVMQRIRSGPRPRPSAYRSDLPSEVDAVVMRALAVERDARFATAGAFVAALEAALAGRVGGRPATQTHALGTSPLDELPNASTVDATARVVSNDFVDATARVVSNDFVDATARVVSDDFVDATARVVSDVVDDVGFDEDRTSTLPSAAPSASIVDPHPGSSAPGLALAVVAVSALLVGAVLWASAWSDVPPVPGKRAVAPVVEPVVTPVPNAVAVPTASVALAPKEPDEPPVAPPPPSRTKRPRRDLRPRPKEPRPEQPRPHPLLAMIADAAAHPEDAAKISRVDREMERLTGRLPQGPERTAIRRCRATAGIASDLGDLKRCAQRLLRSLEASP